jgi:hypothetical protein
MSFNSNDPVLSESVPAALPPELQAALNQFIQAGEKIYWTAYNKLLLDSVRTPGTVVVYALTNRRALAVSPTSSYLQSVRWENVTRVNLKRKSNGRGNLTLVAREGSAYNTLKFKNCPQIQKVQQIVERILLGADSDPFSPPEIEELNPDNSSPEGGLPLRWRSRLEAELLQSEQLRWVGRATPKGSIKLMNTCLVWAGGILAVLLAMAFFAGGDILPPVIIFGSVTIFLTVLVFYYTYFYLLNTALAVTDRRALQVTGMRPGSLDREIEFYPRLDLGKVRADSSATQSMGPGFTDIILVEEDSVSSEGNTAGRAIRFNAIPEQESELILQLLREAYHEKKKTSGFPAAPSAGSSILNPAESNPVSPQPPSKKRSGHKRG